MGKILHESLEYGEFQGNMWAIEYMKQVNLAYCLKAPLVC